MKKALISFIILAMQIPLLSACQRSNITQLTQPTEKHSSSKEATDRWYNNTYDWVKDKYGDASTWCKGHKQDLKRGTIYAYGAGILLLAGVLIRNHYRVAKPAVRNLAG